MKKLCLILIICLILLLASGCGPTDSAVDIVATTLPVYEFTSILCEGTPLKIGRLITENVSCLHDYTLQTSQMQMMECADVVVISGAGLEDFLEDILDSAKTVIDASAGAHIHNSHGHSHADHDSQLDPHLWLSPGNAGIMAENICSELAVLYPAYRAIFSDNLKRIQGQLADLQDYGDEALSTLSCRDLVTFHDGFAYFAASFHLNILKAVEEESGSEASAAELKELILLVEAYHLPSVFTERNGSVSASDVIAAETGVKVFTLDMAMSGSSYFDAMYYNINTVKEALG